MGLQGFDPTSPCDRRLLYRSADHGPRLAHTTSPELDTSPADVASTSHSLPAGRVARVALPRAINVLSPSHRKFDCSFRTARSTLCHLPGVRSVVSRPRMTPRVFFYPGTPRCLHESPVEDRQVKTCRKRQDTSFKVRWGALQVTAPPDPGTPCYRSGCLSLSSLYSPEPDLSQLPVVKLNHR